MNVQELCDDLEAERVDLLAIVRGLVDEWDRATPAPGWSIRDQLTHLAWFDDAARQSIVDPETFVEGRQAALSDVDGFVEGIRSSHAHLGGADLVGWLQTAGEALRSAAIAADPSARVPWYGPSMTLASSLTARIMETWAHGQDVADALGVRRPSNPRLHHVAFLGWRAFANSYAAHGRAVPDVAVRVELDACQFGPADATNVVRGPALDFCLLVTQRRHVADTALITEGPVAAEWLTIAQAFAGPPGAGRQPGQFAIVE